MLICWYNVSFFPISLVEGPVRWNIMSLHRKRRLCVFSNRHCVQVEVGIHIPLIWYVSVCVAVTLFYLCSSVRLQRFCVGVLAVLFCLFSSRINIFHKFQGHSLQLLTQTRSQPRLYAQRYHGNLKANTAEIEAHGWRSGHVNLVMSFGSSFLCREFID